MGCSHAKEEPPRVKEEPPCEKVYDPTKVGEMAQGVVETHRAMLWKKGIMNGYHFLQLTGIQMDNASLEILKPNMVWDPIIALMYADLIGWFWETSPSTDIMLRHMAAIAVEANYVKEDLERCKKCVMYPYVKEALLIQEIQQHADGGSLSIDVPSALQLWDDGVLPPTPRGTCEV
jgi:hypothetical protein